MGSINCLNSVRRSFRFFDLDAVKGVLGRVISFFLFPPKVVSHSLSTFWSRDNLRFFQIFSFFTFSEFELILKR